MRKAFVLAVLAAIALAGLWRSTVRERETADAPEALRPVEVPPARLTPDDRRAMAASDASRAGTWPALRSVVRRDLLPRLEPAGSIVLELGAGRGELYELVNIAALTSRFDVSNVRWEETDSTPALLEQPRRFPTAGRTVVTLPTLDELADDSVSHVAGLSVFPALPPSQLEPMMRAVARVLEPGGVLIHLDDVGIDLAAEVRAAARRGLIPLPYFDQPGAEGLSRPMRVTYIDRARLESALRAGSVAEGLPPELAQVCAGLLASPLELLQEAPLGGFYMLAHDLSRLKVLRRDLDEPMVQLALRRLRAAAGAAGLIVEQAEEVIATATVDRDQVGELPDEVSALDRRYPVRLFEREGPSERVRVSTAVLVFVARAPRS